MIRSASIRTCSNIRIDVNARFVLEETYRRYIDCCCNRSLLQQLSQSCAVTKSRISFIECSGTVIFFRIFAKLAGCICSRISIRFICCSIYSQKHQRVRWPTTFAPSVLRVTWDQSLFLDEWTFYMIEIDYRMLQKPTESLTLVPLLIK